MEKRANQASGKIKKTMKWLRFFIKKPKIHECKFYWTAESILSKRHYVVCKECGKKKFLEPEVGL